MRLALLDPFLLALAIYHQELWLYLGSLAQCEPFSGGSLASLAFKPIATFWLYEIVLKLKHSIQNLGSGHSLSHHC